MSSICSLCQFSPANDADSRCIMIYLFTVRRTYLQTLLAWIHIMLILYTCILRYSLLYSCSCMLHVWREIPADEVILHVRCAGIFVKTCVLWLLFLDFGLNVFYIIFESNKSSFLLCCIQVQMVESEIGPLNSYSAWKSNYQAEHFTGCSSASKQQALEKLWTALSVI